jgi:predicted nucleotidyltransferase
MKELTKQDILEYLKSKKDELYSKYGLVKIGLFGSFVKESYHDKSDIDLAIEIDKKKKTLHNFLSIKRELEEYFGRKVDLGIYSSLKKRVKNSIENEIVYV